MAHTQDGWIQQWQQRAREDKEVLIPLLEEGEAEEQRPASRRRPRNERRWELGGEWRRRDGHDSRCKASSCSAGLCTTVALVEAF